MTNRLPVMSEDQLVRAVVKLARTIHLQIHHCRPALTEQGWRTPIQGTKGFPDLVISGPGGVLFRELKNATKPLQPEQVIWRDVLLAAGADWALWRPKDWPEPITTQIKALRWKAVSV